jgi:hypothetical protein
LAVTAVNANECAGVRKKDGRVEIEGIWTPAKDGHTLHDDYTGIPDNGVAASGSHERGLPPRLESHFNHPNYVQQPHCRHLN